MARPLEKPDDLYETDFYAWTRDQAAKLCARAGFDNRGDIDWANAAEEIRSVGASEKRELRSRLKTLLVHLLKWRFQSAKRKGGWQATIAEQRERIAMVIEDSPSLQSFPRDALAGAYRLAVLKTCEEAELAASLFPPDCPFTIEDVLDPAFYPEAG